jgi:hypothetical protein
LASQRQNENSISLARLDPLVLQDSISISANDSGAISADL